jgi:hypothetical protein
MTDTIEALAFVPAATDPDDLDEVVAPLEELGWRVEVRRQPVNRTGVELVGLLLLLSLKGAVTAAGGLAFTYAVGKVRGALRRRRAAGREAAAEKLVLQDTDSAVRVEIDADTPPEAVDILVTQWTQGVLSAEGTYRYDVMRNAWSRSRA